MNEAHAGTCSACGNDLVQTPTRTYHPASLGDIDCPNLLPIPGLPYPEYRSSQVPASLFVPTPHSSESEGV